MKIKPASNNKISVSFTDVGKSCPVANFYRHKYVFERYLRKYFLYQIPSEPYVLVT